MAGVDVKLLARIGAELRISQIRAELHAILAAYPDLRRANRGRQLKRSGANTSATAPRERRRMTAAQKAEISQRMKTYWAKRRQSAASKKAAVARKRRAAARKAAQTRAANEA